MNTNERTPKTASLKKRAIAAVITIAIALIVIMLLMLSCTSAAPAGDADASDTSRIARSNDAAGSSGIAQGDALPESDNEIGEDASSSNTATEQAASTQDMQQETGEYDSASQATAPGRTAPSNDSASTQPQKTWAEDTERIWVVDKEAWTESVPVYGTVEVSICNICGTDITGNTSAHAKEHMKAGEGSGHHSEVRREITGYNTVSHKEEGHWVIRVTGGRWE